MLRLEAALQAWHTATFGTMLKAELEAIKPSSLPLHLCVSQGGMVDDKAISAIVLSSRDGEGRIEIKVGVFFTEIVINCGCGDDPMPINAYCELLINIDKLTAEATITVLTD